MTARHGFRTTSDVVAIICFVFSLLYFFLGNGPEAVRLTIASYRAQKKESLLGKDMADNVSHTTAKSRVSKMSSMMLQMNTPNISNVYYDEPKQQEVYLNH